MSYQGVCLLLGIYNWSYTRSGFALSFTVLGFAIYFGLAYYFSQVKAAKADANQLTSSGTDI